MFDSQTQYRSRICPNDQTTLMRIYKQIRKLYQKLHLKKLHVKFAKN